MLFLRFRASIKRYCNNKTKKKKLIINERCYFPLAGVIISIRFFIKWLSFFFYKAMRYPIPFFLNCGSKLFETRKCHISGSYSCFQAAPSGNEIKTLGHAVTGTSTSAKYWYTKGAVCGLLLSCVKIRFLPINPGKGTRRSCKISSI